MTGAAPVWVVASADTARRWSDALAEAALVALPLAWSEIVGVGEGAHHVRTIAESGAELVLLTSPSALDVLPDGAGSGRAAACVGERTARAARAKGFAVLHTGAGTGEDLARELLAGRQATRLLLLRGRQVRAEGLRLYAQAGWPVEEAIVYEARERPAFTAEVGAAPAPGAFVVGSPRGAEALERALVAAGRGIWRRRPALGVGSTTTERLQTLSFHAAVPPAVPGVEGLVERLRDLLP